ncbi:MAG TPA: tRNA guanosine(34) transglycosylase Tgt, partial [Euryarchaeota archaeon]|nr:tRNA guanosine(34) transglycosylase Tgt [Euryarchaeota archaeon]
ETPFFMPVATRASVKTLLPEEFLKTSVVISNAFMLHLRPGEAVIEKLGGLHRYMDWNGGIFADSGGFQLIRQGFDPKITDEGVFFKSPYDGKVELLTPEDVLKIEDALGVDVGMVLDHCPPYPSKPEGLHESAKRTLYWAKRAITHKREKGLMFGIVQGGTDLELRRAHSKKLGELDFDGFGIGGLSIGETSNEMFTSLEASLFGLMVEKPRYFMGLGSDMDILRSISMGVDIFDSVYPTRNARHKTALVGNSSMNIGKKKYKDAPGSIEKGCRCPVCKRFSLAYVNNLLRDDELLGLRLLTMHNLHHVQTLMEEARTSLKEGDFSDFIKGRLSMQ